jgi:hypothetical protein
MNLKERSRIFFKRIFLYDVIYKTLHTYYVFRRDLIRSRNYNSNMVLYITSVHKIEKSKTALFYLTNPNFALHCFPIMTFYHKNGYFICLAHNYHFISRCVFGVRSIFKLNNFSIVRKRRLAEKFDVCFFDEPAVDKKIKTKTKFCIENIHDISSLPIDANKVFVPYPMHPMVYDIDIYSRIYSYRAVDRKMKIFFSGNTHRETYTQHKIREKYNMLDRFEIIDSLRKRLGPDKLQVAETTEYIDGIFMGKSNYSNKLTMIDWQWKIEFGKFDLRIENIDWVYFLSRADFFLACPGVKIPFCHNIIEAMSVGTIPLTNYGHLFNPPLLDMENCISFSSMDELLVKIDLILEMNPEEIDKIRKNVIAYYDQILDIEKFSKHLMEDAKEVMTELIVFSEQFE